jgi:hypothetical protein
MSGTSDRSDCYWREVIRRLLCCDCERIFRIVRYQVNGVSFIAKGDHMSLVLQTTEVPGSVSVSVAFVDSEGKPATVDGVPTWAASDPALLDSITPSADGLSATVHIADKEGASNLTLTADVDLGDGVKSKDFVDTISVIAAEATTATFNFGPVTPDAGGGPT